MSRRLQAILAAAGFVFAGAVSSAEDKADMIYGSQKALDTSYHSSGGIGPMTAIAILLLAAGGVWLLLKGRNIKVPGRSVRRLAIEETRSLGSRQYLVVASYDGKKLLLGVCPGKIDLLTELGTDDSKIGGVS